MQGEFARRISSAGADQLIEARALLEAGIDFSDEGDVPGNLAAQAVGDAEAGSAGDRARLSGVAGERLRDGLQVVIAGAPNVGKSTLLNRLARRDVAIVSPAAGTTRDVIEVHLDLGGYPVTLRDTAGIRSAADPVEQEGVRRAEHWVAASDLILWVVDASRSRLRASSSGASLPTRRPPAWIVVNKVDLLEIGASIRNELEFISSVEAVFLQFRPPKASGMDALVAAIGEFAQSALQREAGLVTRERHRQMMALRPQRLSEALHLADRRAQTGARS